MIELDEHGAAVDHHLHLGAEFLIVDVLHGELHDGILDAIPTEDVRGH